MLRKTRLSLLLFLRPSICIVKMLGRNPRGYKGGVASKLKIRNAKAGEGLRKGERDIIFKLEKDYYIYNRLYVIFY